MGAWMISTDGSKGSARFGKAPATDTRIEIHTVHHGVSSDYAPALTDLGNTIDDYDKGKFRVVHFSTTDGQRKGTFELVQAWHLLRQRGGLPPEAELLLVLDDHARRALQERMLDADLRLADGARMLPRGNLMPHQMSRLLCHMHALAAPSRGEGFGLTVLEARACGVVTVSTRTTGHSAGHCDGLGTVSIWQNDTPVPIDDGPAAVAPAVTPAHIADALKRSFDEWRSLSREAMAVVPLVAERWSWQQQLAGLVGLLR